MDPKRNRDLMMPAGRVLGVMLIALAIAALLQLRGDRARRRGHAAGHDARRRALGRPPARRRGRHDRPAPAARGPRPRLRAGGQDRARAPSSRRARRRSCADGAGEQAGRQRARVPPAHARESDRGARHRRLRGRVPGPAHDRPGEAGPARGRDGRPERDRARPTPTSSTGRSTRSRRWTRATRTRL